MEITEHQAAILRAIVDGKTIQYRGKASEPEERFAVVTQLTHAMSFLLSPNHEVRIKPDVIVVNGIEVPAPVKVAPERNAEYWVADVSVGDGCSGPIYWNGDEDDRQWLKYEIVHRSPEAAGAHGRAMRAHKPG